MYALKVCWDLNDLCAANYFYYCLRQWKITNLSVETTLLNCNEVPGTGEVYSDLFSSGPDCLDLAVGRSL